MLTYNTKKRIKDLTGLAYRMSVILKDDVDELRLDADGLDIGKITNSLNDVIESSERLADTIAELEYVLYCNRNTR